MCLLTFCGIFPSAEAIVFALSMVRFLIMDPNENTTIPSSPELCTNSSMSYKSTHTKNTTNRTETLYNMNRSKGPALSNTEVYTQSTYLSIMK